MSNPNEQYHDSDEDEEFEDVEFEDVPLRSSRANGTHKPPAQRTVWTPELSLPRQRDEPIASGSEEETQLRGRLSEGIDRINYREMRGLVGMDVPDTPVTERGYTSFAQLCQDVEALVNALWASATRESIIPPIEPILLGIHVCCIFSMTMHVVYIHESKANGFYIASILGEGLITLAGLTEAALRAYPFDPASTLTVLHKFDQIFAALCTGVHPLSRTPLPGTQSGRSLVTQTQKVRMRSLAESTRSKVFSCLVSEDEDGEDEEMEQVWSLAATKVYEATLMLLGDQGDVDDAGEFECPG